MAVLPFRRRVFVVLGFPALLASSGALGACAGASNPASRVRPAGRERAGLASPRPVPSAAAAASTPVSEGVVAPLDRSRPTTALPAPSEVPVTAPPTPPTPPPANLPPRRPPTWPERIAALRADPAFATHLDLLAAAEQAGPAATSALSMARLPDLEAAARARVGRGTGWAVVTTFVEPGADARALRAAYLDFDRLGEWTGKPSTTVLERRGDVTVVKSDGIRSAFGIRFGARWRFETRAVERDGILALVTRKVDDPDTISMVETRGLLLLVPEAGGVRSVETSASLLDYEVPALLQKLAAGMALNEMKARSVGIRTHWQEYVGR